MPCSHSLMCTTSQLFFSCSWLGSLQQESSVPDRVLIETGIINQYSMPIGWYSTFIHWYSISISWYSIPIDQYSVLINQYSIPINQYSICTVKDGLFIHDQSCYTKQNNRSLCLPWAKLGAGYIPWCKDLKWRVEWRKMVQWLFRNQQSNCHTWWLYKFNSHDWF